MQIIYDGDCVFCQAYVKMTKLKKNHDDITLINAREDNHPLVQKVKSLNIDLNEGMVVFYNNKYYHGHEAVNLLALMTTKSDFFNWLMANTFKRQAIAKVMYPVLRLGRNVTLFLRGKKKIQ